MPQKGLQGVLPPVYPILDTGAAAAHGVAIRECATALLEGGARLLQFRHKAFWDTATAADLEWLSAVCAAAGCQLVVNDRADLAAVFAAGLHVGQDDLPPAEARRILGDRLLGYSTHNAEQLLAGEAEPADYLALGPVYPTVSKARPDPVVGLEQLQRLCATARKPVVAIGGITLERAPEIWRAGAASIALISDLYAEGAAPAQIRRRMEQWLARAN